MEAFRNVLLLGAEDGGDAVVARHQRGEDAAEARVLLRLLLQLHRLLVVLLLEGEELSLVDRLLAPQLLLAQQPLRLLLLQRPDGLRS